MPSKKSTLKKDPAGGGLKASTTSGKIKGSRKSLGSKKAPKKGKK